MQTIIKEFEEISGFPQAVRIVDGCHIKIKAPLKDVQQYINRKDYHSIVSQGLVDNNCLFRDVLVGRPAKSHDARIFKNPHSIRSVYKEHFYPEPRLDIYKILLLYHCTGRFSLSTRRIYYEALR